MKTLDIMRRAGRNLRQAKGRTFLTSLAIGVGAFTVAASLAAGEGARQYADKIIKSNVDPQSVYVTKDKLRDTATIGGGLSEYSENSSEFNGVSIDMLDAEDLTTLKSIDGVRSVLPTYLVQTQYVQFEEVDTKYTSDVMTYDATVLASTAAGSLPELGTQIGVNDAVIPEAYAETLGKKPADLVGKTITLRLVKAGKQPTEEEVQQAFISGGTTAAQALYAQEVKDVVLRIRAVSAKSSTSFSASMAVFLSDAKAEELSSWLTEGTSSYKQYVSATVMVKAGVDPETVKEAVKSKDLSALTSKDISGMIFTMVNVLQGIVTGFGILALIASVFGIINTQYISVLERTSQIGLMKALGMPRRAVAKLFRYEAAWIGCIGGIIGALVAYTVGTALNPWITEVLTLGEGNYLLIFVWWHILLMIATLMLVAIVAGWLPARKAARLDPIEALRTE
jgi:putative ABC transport system permease protein